jgi:hypothetical protein
LVIGAAPRVVVNVNGEPLSESEWIVARLAAFLLHHEQLLKLLQVDAMALAVHHPEPSLSCLGRLPIVSVVS